MGLDVRSPKKIPGWVRVPDPGGPGSGLARVVLGRAGLYSVFSGVPGWADALGCPGGDPPSRVLGLDPGPESGNLAPPPRAWVPGPGGLRVGVR